MALNKKVKVMVCGSRTITDKEWIFSQIEQFWYWNLACYSDITLIEGEARGVDKISAEYAKENQWEILPFPADWDKYGRAAGPIRNDEMIKACDCCLVLWDGKSKGTGHDVHLCNKYKKPFQVVEYNDEKHENYIDIYPTQRIELDVNKLEDANESK